MSRFDPLAITSAQNPRVKAVRRLHEAKGRRETGCFLLEGTTLLREAMALTWPLEAVYGTAEWRERHPLIEKAVIPALIVVRDHVMAAMSTHATPQGVLAVARIPEDVATPSFKASRGRARDADPKGARSVLGVVADGVSDPANLGAIIRAADAAGGTCVVVGPGSVDPFSPKVARGSMGSILHVPISCVADLAAFRMESRTCGIRWLALLSTSGQSLYETDLSGPIALWVGNEATGISSEEAAQADIAVSIPMPGRAESLNAAMAASICLFEAVRQRL